MKLLILLLLFLPILLYAFELDFSGYGTFHRGNQFSTVYGSKFLFEFSGLEIKSYGEYQRFKEEKYHKYGSYGGYDHDLSKSYGLFMFARADKDTTKKTELSSLAVAGLYYRISNDLKYSLGLGYEYIKYYDEDKHHGIVVSHRLKYRKKIKALLDLSSVLWVYHFTNNMRVLWEAGFRGKVSDNLRFGIIQEIEYNTNPISSSIKKEDYRLMLEGVLSFGGI